MGRQETQFYDKKNLPFCYCDTPPSKSVGFVTLNESDW